MENEIILSICIPTDGTMCWVSRVLDGIYQQDCDASKYEVVITDNGSNNELENYIKEKDFKNLTYQRSASKGFQNIIDSLKLGKGLYCKVLNHRAVLQSGVIDQWLEIIDKYKNDKPIIYCSNKNLPLEDVTECPDINTFVEKMSFWSSWMGGIGIWDVDKPVMDTIKYDNMFPNTSLLFELRQQSKYIIINTLFQKELESKGKGGYNLFRTFGVDYLDILNDLRQRDRITIQTFISVKKRLRRWFDGLYLQEFAGHSGHTFDLSDIETSMQVYFTREDFKRMRRMAYLFYYPTMFMSFLRNLKKL